MEEIVNQIHDLDNSDNTTVNRLIFAASKFGDFK